MEWWAEERLEAQMVSPQGSFFLPNPASPTSPVARYFWISEVIMCNLFNLQLFCHPVWVHPQLDKLSQGWVLSLPGPKGLNQTLFSETMARLLCLFSPSCAASVGAPLGQRGLVVDPFGDNVLSISNIPGGSFTARHDLVKTCLQTLCMDAGLRAECEVFGAFRDLLPIQALEQDDELRAGRNRAGLIPDFCLDFPEPGADVGALGGVRRTLAEL